MTRHTAALTAQALAQLAQEHDALRRADFAGLAQLMPQRDAAFQALDGHSLPPDDLHRLKTAAQRNQALAAALHDGVSAARHVLSQLSRPDGFSAYGPDGVRQQLGRP